MALTERTVEDKIVIGHGGVVVDKQALIIEDNGVEVSRSKGVPRAINPSEVANERSRIKDIVGVVVDYYGANPIPTIPDTGLFQTDEIQIEVLSDGQIQARTTKSYYKDGAIVRKKNQRHVVDPIDDTTNEHPLIISLAAVLHTPEVVTARQSFIEGQL